MEFIKQPSLSYLRDPRFWEMDVKFGGQKRTAAMILKDAKSLKTQSKYDQAWDNFCRFNDNADVRELTEEIFIQYFDYLIREKKFVYSTLWSIFSMLNSESQVRSGPKLNDYARLILLIKSQEKGYSPKQGSILSSEEIDQFLENAPFTGFYTLQKAALVIGMFGGLRCNEMANLVTTDISKSGDNGYWVEYSVSKQKQDNVRNKFYIPEKHASHITGYLDCIGKHEGRFFCTFVASEKGNFESGTFKTTHPMGKNTLAKIPSQIALFLNLPNHSTYTGHSFRRSSATLYANAGASSLNLKQHLNWKSDAVVMRYINQSTSQKVTMSNLISGGNQITTNNASREKNDHIINISDCSNIVIHL